MGYFQGIAGNNRMAHDKDAMDYSIANIGNCCGAQVFIDHHGIKVAARQDVLAESSPSRHSVNSFFSMNVARRSVTFYDPMFPVNDGSYHALSEPPLHRTVRVLLQCVQPAS